MKTLYTWDKCPHCGSTEKVGDEVIEAQKAQKLIPADSKGAAIISPIMLGSRAGLTTVTMMTAANVCAKCGAIYASQCEISNAPTSQIMAPPHAGGSRPPFGRAR